MTIEQLTNTDFMWHIWNSSEDSRPACEKMAGVDGITPAKFQRNISREIVRLQRELRNGTYSHNRLRHYVIDGARGDRPRIICTATQRDKLLQRMLCRYLTTDLATGRPLDRLGIGTGIAYGMRRDFQETTVQALSKIVRVRRTKPCGVKTDIYNFYNRIRRDDIMSILSERIEDPDILALLDQVVRAEIKGAPIILRNLFSENDMQVGLGLRQGMPLSPILANALLTQFDAALNIPQWFNAYRVADDILCLCSTEEQASRILRIIEDRLSDLSQTIPAMGDDRGKTRIFNADDTVKFLGVNIHKAPNNRYTQNIPTETVNRACDKIIEIFSVTHEKYRDLSMSERRTRFQSLLNGYKGYFYNCENYQRFLNTMENRRSLESRRLINRMLPNATIEHFRHLNPDQKKLLGIGL